MISVMGVRVVEVISGKRADALRPGAVGKTGSGGGLTGKAPGR
jgi:hypothetical protein